MFYTTLIAVIALILAVVYPLIVYSVTNTRVNNLKTDINTRLDGITVIQGEFSLKLDTYKDYNDKASTAIDLANRCAADCKGMHESFHNLHNKFLGRLRQEKKEAKERIEQEGDAQIGSVDNIPGTEQMNIFDLSRIANQQENEEQQDSSKRFFKKQLGFRR